MTIWTVSGMGELVAERERETDEEGVAVGIVPVDEGVLVSDFDDD